MNKLSIIYKTSCSKSLCRFLPGYLQIYNRKNAQKYHCRWKNERENQKHRCYSKKRKKGSRMYTANFSCSQSRFYFIWTKRVLSENKPLNKLFKTHRPFVIDHARKETMKAACLFSHSIQTYSSFISVLIFHHSNCGWISADSKLFIGIPYKRVSIFIWIWIENRIFFNSEFE